MAYQHKVTIYNHETGIGHRGVFRTRDAAEAFMAATPGQQKSYDAECGTCVYEIYEFPFNPIALREAFIGDHQINGRD